MVTKYITSLILINRCCLQIAESIFILYNRAAKKFKSDNQVIVNKNFLFKILLNYFQILL